jgi:hypothetical protein
MLSRPIQSLKLMALMMVSLTLVTHVTQHTPHNIISGLCHSIGLRFITTTYVTKESYVTNHYAMKAYVTQ